MIDLADYGFRQEMLPDDACGLPARVIITHRERYTLICGHGECAGILKPSVYYNDSSGGETFPTTGDFVLIDYNPAGDSRIVRTLARRSRFSRSNFSGRTADYAGTVLEQVVAANFDYVFILQSLNQDLNVRRLERYLVLAWQSGAVPVVILTKSDLAQDIGESLRTLASAAVGVEMYPVSAKTGHGLDALSSFLQPRKTIVFLGSSGVGKSTLVNALAGQEIMEVSDIREDDGRGRHTTTYRELIMLPGGVMVIDTPGMREIGMWDAGDGLGEAFADVEEYFGKCRFADCRHGAEPGCAVREAVDQGLLPRERWESYLQLKKETRYAEDKAGYLRERQQWHKDITMQIRRMKKNGGIKK